ncbi:glycosyl transferase [Leuconostoc citreum]
MIERKIHYVWFGGEVPKNVKNLVEQWKEKLPDWEFFFWNENNLPHFENDEYTQLIIKNQKLGFASDLLRYQLVNEYGGFYLDTDMEIHRNLDGLLIQDTVFGFMYDNNLHTGMFGANSQSKWLQKMINVYTDPNEKLFEMTRDFSFTSNIIVTLATKELYGDEFHLNGKSQIMDDGTLVLDKNFFVYPSNHRIEEFAKHNFSNSWNGGKAYKGMRGLVKRIIRSVFGNQAMESISAFVGKKRTKKLLKKMGVKNG